MVSPLQITMPGQARTRKKRKPQYPLSGTMRPFGIYPMWATPVLPGETLNMAETKYRLLSMPVKHPLAGAWFETWLVYVSLTDIDPLLAQMFITSDTPTTGFTAGSDLPRYYTKSGQINYLRLATDRVVETYFRNEEEPGALTRTMLAPDLGIHLAQRQNWDWAQNLMFKPASMDMADMPSSLPTEGTLTPLEIMKMAGMSELTYEKYLMEYGVVQKEAIKEARKPEILRYTRDWTTPVNTVEPTTGRPSSCWSWSSTIKSDKPRRFDEPGFVIMLGCVRPKMFDPTLTASMIGEMWGFGDWFPVYNLEDPAAGIKQLDGAVLVRPGGSDDPLIYDHRDLLSHGEQFVNDWAQPYDLPSITSRNMADLQSYPNLRGLYPTSDNIDALFVEDAEETPRTAFMRCYYEGIAGVEITGHVVDTTK